jgi:hypothetical protein
MTLAAGSGALALADQGGLLFQDSKLFRDTRQAVNEVIVPPLPEAECVLGRVEAEAVRMITFHAIGNAGLFVDMSDFGFGVFVGDSFQELLVVRVGAVNFSTGHLPPGTIVTFVFIDPVDFEVVTTDPAIIAEVQAGSRVQYAIGGGGGSIGCSGSCGVRVGANISARFDLEIYD